MTARRLGIMGAMDSETSALRAAIEDVVEETVLGCTLASGLLDGQPVVLATSGVGKVNAALTTAAMATAGIDELVFTGVAGGVGDGLRQGDVVIATTLIQHDVDVTVFGRMSGYIGERPAGGPADEALSARLVDACRSLGLEPVRGVIASGDQFIADKARAHDIARRFGAVAVEMEGAAVAQVCTRLGLPFACLRWVSDAADDDALDDAEDFIGRAAGLDLAVMRAFVG